jgi:hypothetical protein
VSLTRALESAQAGLPVISRPELSPAVHWSSSQQLPIHRWFRYREGFSPYLFDHFGLGRSRFDPFCGCGTTLVESAKQGVPSAGIDVNPLATFLARTKTRRYSKSERMLFARLSAEALCSYRSLEPMERPSFPLLGKVFLPSSLSTLLRLNRFIGEVENSCVRDLLRLAWLSILEDASNVYKEGNGIKYRNKLRRPGRYLTLPDAVWVPRYFGSSIRRFVENLWFNKCLEIVEDLGATKNTVRARPSVHTGSCLDSSIMPHDSYDVAVFSPPYANRFDYFEAFKIELWMGGFVGNAIDVRSLRNASIRNNLASKRVDIDHTWDRLAPFLSAMDDDASSVRMGIKEALEGYFIDMRTLFRNLRTTLSRKGQVVMVVGNSAYAGVIIPTDALLGRVAQEEGFRVKQIYVARHLHVSSQQRTRLRRYTSFMRESVMVLDRGRGR